MKALPRCKMCRREGKKLFLKGDRCNSSRCALVKRKYPPGANGPKGYPRLSEYALQLRAKQSLKRTYGISEKQCHNYFQEAKNKSGNTEITFLKLLELRIDNVVFRAGLAPSRRATRQLISHNNILLNNKPLNIPSYQVKVGDTIKVKSKKKIQKMVKDNLAFLKDKGKETLPAWLDVDLKNLEIKILKEPEEKDLPQEFDNKLIIAFYSR
ncbi:30S ribosomal protein S4 [Patescibacteria group bacterium]|nr:30S ribosomal protein S4 [Patescibacteria group bacterium]